METFAVFSSNGVCCPDLAPIIKDQHALIILSSLTMAADVQQMQLISTTPKGFEQCILECCRFKRRCDLHREAIGLVFFQALLDPRELFVDVDVFLVAGQRCHEKHVVARPFR